ncbi:MULTISPECIES: FeoB-associated Cys-rich membrane protein [Sporomusa]|jgi:hypothetical protein|uniref:Virus attachment protein p12 family protein n=1 Tax=Sporomusa sphaeroides DSM 2875 TaxID=1337886 RepID=A0ABM9W7D4_9FIRM|nr:MULTISPECIES: FeoB-associated Cys-rich membrane protein [Sporomusa]MCM0758176.1 FeoB-associated Cys-rich membrane protein [Sporomusa sphaeroides DSM 2875]OLS54566.1 hypothetical protein SPSPH_43510 [Sporomusa sphaeroides DSM 2875]CVK20798.1 hypothetical protein SSPH_03466 [Sporomusa sphaeroides DSM 2875]HML32844.1 FeoB-associated Cys-rich membrane protein [Sporomusa sphaeroides]
MDNLVLILIGLAAVGYVGRMVWKNLHGEPQCHCDGGCGSGCHKENK